MPDELKRTEEQTTPAKVPNRVPKRVEAKEGTVKKKSFWKRVKDAIFEGTVEDIGVYLWKDVLVPSIKKLLAESINNATNLALWGDSRPRYGRDDGRTHVSQSSVYSGRAYSQRNTNYNRANRYDRILEGCLFSYREVPLQIIHEAMDWINDYGFVSVETFNQILPGAIAFETVYTDRDWGWTSLNENCIVPVPGGWTIDLPPARPLSR